MSDKSTKRPAHEVILRKLEEKVIELDSPSVVDGQKVVLREVVSAARRRALAVISSLHDVTRDMVIPKKEREKVLAELQRIAAMWKPKIAGLNLIADLHRILSQEQ